MSNIPIVFKGEIVFVRLLLPVLVGILAGFSVNSWLYFYYFSFISGCLFAALIALYLGYKRYEIYFKKWLPGIVLHLFLFFVALAITTFQKDSLKPDYYSRIKAEGFIVTVSSEPKVNGNYIRFECKVNKAICNDAYMPVKGKLLVSLKANQGEKFHISYGDQLVIPALIKPIDPPYNPFEFDYKAYLSSLGIGNQTFLRQDQVLILAREKGNPVVSYAYKLRKYLVQGFTTFIPDKESAALASTLILGYKAELSQDIIMAYSKTGTMHVLSVSGMHVLLVFDVLAFLLFFLNKNKRLKIIKVILILASIWFYTLLTGFSSAACRAAVMCSIFAIGKTFIKRTNAYNTVAASALLLLIYNPYFLLDAGFQLSYVAVLGLIYLYPKVLNIKQFKSSLAQKLWNFTAVSIAAQIATVPLSLYYFHQFPVYFLLSNLFIIYPVFVIMYGGIVFLVFFLLKKILPVVLLQWVGSILHFVISFMNKGLLLIEHLSYSSLSFFPYGILFYASLFIAILVMLMAFQFKSKRFLIGSLLVFLSLALYTSYNQIERKQMKQIVLFSLRKQRAIGFFNGDKSYLYSNITDKDQAYAYSIKPSIDAYSKNCCNLSNSDNMGVFLNNNFIRFSNWKMFLVSPSFKLCNYHNAISVNAVLISENPKIKLANLIKSVRFSILFIDGSNNDYKINRWVSEAKVLKIKYYVLKRNKAYIIDFKS